MLVFDQLSFRMQIKSICFTALDIIYMPFGDSDQLEYIYFVYNHMRLNVYDCKRLIKVLSYFINEHMPQQKVILILETI